MWFPKSIFDRVNRFEPVGSDTTNDGLISVDIDCKSHF